MKKKLLAIMLCLVMVAATVSMLVACDNGNNGENGNNGGDGATTYNITVWVGEGTKELTLSQIAKFNELNADTVKFNATVEIVSESKAVGDIEGKPTDSWPDIFTFAQDQLARAVKGNMLQSLNASSISTIQTNSTDNAIAAVTVGNTIRAFPMTADNGYFMYYDKSVITDESHLTSLEALIEDCENAQRYFSMSLEDGAWYAASFFYAAGCKSEWTTDENGRFTKYDDNFKSDKGVIALQGMQKLLKSDWHNDSDKAAGFNASLKSAVVISGIWDYNTAKDALGDNLGIAPLPSYTVDGNSYQLQSYLGHKLLGIKPQSDAYKSYYLQLLAAYLTGADCQKARFEQLGWGPSDKSLQNLSTAALNMLKGENIKTNPQGQYPDEWWTQVNVMVQNAKKAGSDAASLLIVLEDNYNSKLSGFLS